MANNVKTGVYMRNGVEETFNFYTSISTLNKLNFIKFVVNSIVDNDNYYSILKDLVFDFAIINVFTDIDVSEIKESTNSIGMIERLLDETNIVDIVKENVDNGVIEELNDAIEKNIEYKTGIHKNPIADSVVSLLNTIEQKVSEFDTSSMVEMAKIMSEVSGELTADKMLEAYTNSDMFKKNYEQIKDQAKLHNDNIIDIAKELNKTEKKTKKKK